MTLNIQNPGYDPRSDPGWGSGVEQNSIGTDALARLWHYITGGGSSTPPATAPLTSTPYGVNGVGVTPPPLRSAQPMSQPSQGGGYGASPTPMPVVPSGSTPDTAIAAGGHPNYGPAGSNMPWPSQVNPSGIPWTSQHPAATAVAANATPGGRDITVHKAAAPNAFTPIAAPNQTGMEGAMGRGGARRMMSALDLSSLFGNVPNPT